MITVEIPYNDDIRKLLWPSFKISLEEKHGDSGTQGLRGEQNAVALIDKHLNFPICYDHSKDVVGQLFGIDFTLISTGTIITVDVKSGRSSLYWNKNKKRWYVTVQPSYFSKRKKNTHIMHVGPKGDLFVMYKKEDLVSALKNGDVEPFEEKEDKLLIDVEDIKSFSKHNFNSGYYE